jgi:hypothetical protein
MSNIFNFRPKKSESLNSDFLKDADDTVQFDQIDRGIPLDQTPQHVLQTHQAELVQRDWSNQELANIYRVKKLLDAAGVPNGLERGITDEGDPWCIFCAHGGEVFIHLCRIDGRYVLDSPNLRAPLSGADFAELIENFSDGTLSGAAGRKRVIKLQRGGKVFLHPATLLAALIWSIYIQSEDLVLVAPEEGAATDAGLEALNSAAMAPLSSAEHGDLASFLQMTAAPDHLIGARAPQEERDGVLMRDLAGKTVMALSAAPVAVGLSSVALAFGLMQDGFFDSAPEDTAALPALGTEIDIAEADITDTNSGNPSRSAGFDLAAVLQSVFDEAPQPDTAPSALTAALAADIDLSKILSSILSLPSPAETALTLASGVQDSWFEDLPSAPALLPDPKTAEGKTTAEKGRTTLGPTETTADAGDLSIMLTPDFDLAALLDFATAMLGDFQSFELSGVTVQASFDLSDLEMTPKVQTPDPANTPAELDVTPVNTNPAQDVPTLQGSDDTDLPVGSSTTAMDFNARAFIQHLINMSRSGEVEMVTHKNEVVLIDVEVMQANRSDTHAMQWEMADGSMVYTIGMKTDYMEFDLIA